jgi:UDP-glucuronate decarboxylase
LDNFFTGKEENISHLLKNENFKILNHDICEEIFIEVDEIYNLACPASPSHYQIDPIYTMKTSFMGALNVLELARKLKVKKIFQASTSEVYGDPKEHPQNEKYFGNVNPIGVRSCYDVGKRCAETLFFDYFRRYNIPIKVGRIFNTYGPKMQVNDGRVVSNFIVQALKNEDLTVYGDGSQTRSFCYVDDLVDGFIKFMESDENVTGPINLGNPREYTVLELAKLIIEMTGSSSRIVFKKLPFDDPKRRRPDIGKAKKLIGWEPIVGLKEGLLETIKYFDKKVFVLEEN